MNKLPLTPLLHQASLPHQQRLPYPLRSEILVRATVNRLCNVSWLAYGSCRQQQFAIYSGEMLSLLVGV